MNVFSKLKNTVKEKGACFIVLLDPDNKNNGQIDDCIDSANENGVDAFFIGGSFMMDASYHKRVRKIKSKSNIPLILFPGGVNQINEYFDAMLFMSLISGRNTQYLIGEQVIASPIVKDLNIETIPTGYILIESGKSTTVEIISGTQSIPSDRMDIILSHALAGQFLGMQLIYLEAGSGAEKRVQDDIIKYVSKEINIDLVVGGGISTPEDANNVALSGASYVVVGSIFESSTLRMNEFASAIHYKNKS